MGFSKGQAGQLLRKSRGILTVLRISLLGSFPQGRRDIIAKLRIQTAAEGVNGFGKASQTPSLMTAGNIVAFTDFGNIED
jgi:hypothetical protein